MNERQRPFRQFIAKVFGESIFQPIYASLAVAGGFAVISKIAIAVVALLPDVSVPKIVAGPISWQLYIAVLVLISHGQPNEATLDLEEASGRYWTGRAVEALAILMSFVFVGLLVVFIEPLFPFTFFALSLMVFSIMYRRILSDSTEPSIQILRFVSACWFLLVGVWIYLLGNELSWKIEVFSWGLLGAYLYLIYRRIRG